MRDPGDQRMDSSVADDVMPPVVEQQHHDRQQQQHMEIDADGNFDLGDNFASPTEVSTGCFSRLSPTFVVYMAAFVSSLTSVLLGYGEYWWICCVWRHSSVDSQVRVFLFFCCFRDALSSSDIRIS